MTIHKLSHIFYLVTWGLISLLILFIVLRFFEQRELKHIQEVRYASFIAADKLRQSPRYKYVRPQVVLATFPFLMQFAEGG